jgi:predicted permease
MNHRKGGRSLADAALDGLNAAYPNVGYMGFPLCLLVFGRGSLIAVTITAIVTVCVIFAGAIVLIEAASHAERNPLRLVAKVAGTLARNPLLVAPVLGAAVSGLGYHPAGSIETFFRMLGGSASPCALVALGLFLAERRGRQGTGAAIGLTAAKLVVLPVVTWALCRLLPMPPVMAEAAVLLAALPTGTGPFMLAEFYRREAMVTARTILASTVTSVLTLSVLIYFIRHGWL